MIQSPVIFGFQGIKIFSQNYKKGIDIYRKRQYYNHARNKQDSPQGGQIEGGIEMKATVKKINGVRGFTPITYAVFCGEFCLKIFVSKKDAIDFANYYNNK